MFQSRDYIFQTLKLLRLLGILVSILVMPRISHGNEDSFEKPQFWIPTTALSNQTETPFLFIGKPVSPEHPRWEHYSEVIEEFDTANDCLAPSTTIAEEVDVLAINWSALRSHRAVEVCLFRIFSSIGDIHKIREWLTLQQYRLLENRFSKTETRYLETSITSKTFVTIEGYLNSDVFEDRVKIFRYGLGWLHPAKGYMIQVVLSEAGEVVSIFSGMQGR